MRWRIIDTGKATAAENMEMDLKLLQSLDAEKDPILHFYDWKGACATHGYFTNHTDYLNAEGIKHLQIDCARRPTGGGIIFHHCDFAFSVLVPASHPAYSINTLDNYAFVNRLVMQTIHRFIGEHTEPSLLASEPVAADKASAHFCMAKPTKYDVIVNNQKVGGAAQRRCRQGFLHQGSIALTLPSDEFLDMVLHEGTAVKQSIKQNSFLLIQPHASHDEIDRVRRKLRGLLANTALSLL
jgi:lipoate-protein ligase A